MTETRTDREMIRTAFATLRRKGYKARMNFACCSSCGWAELDSGDTDEKIVFYNKQSHARSFERGAHDLQNDLHLQWSGDAETIVSALDAAGLTERIVTPDDHTDTITILAHPKPVRVTVADLTESDREAIANAQVLLGIIVGDFRDRIQLVQTELAPSTHPLVTMIAERIGWIMRKDGDLMRALSTFEDTVNREIDRQFVLLDYQGKEIGWGR